MSDFPVTQMTRVTRKADRGHYDRETIYKIIDQTFICHVGFVVEGQPFVIPTLHGRQDDQLILHGSPASRLIQYAKTGQPMCVEMTILDGLVLAKTLLNHSVNYRSVVLFGTAALVADQDAKLQALKCLTEHITPGRWDEARLPTRREMDTTAVLKMNIENASAKIRTGGPKDDPADQDLPVWAGILPVHQALLQPQPAPYCGAENGLPEYIRDYFSNKD